MCVVGCKFLTRRKQRARAAELGQLQRVRELYQSEGERDHDDASSENSGEQGNAGRDDDNASMRDEDDAEGDADAMPEPARDAATPRPADATAMPGPAGDAATPTPTSGGSGSGGARRKRKRGTQAGGRDRGHMQAEGATSADA